MRRVGIGVGVLLAVLVFILVPLSAVVELPLEKEIKTALGTTYPKSCDDYKTVGQGDSRAWRDERPLPTLRDEPRGVTLGDTVFLAGGAQGDEVPQSVATFQGYSFRTGRYSHLPPLPEKLNHVGIAVHDGDVWVVGGFKDGARLDLDPADGVYRYDPSQRRWTSVTKLPTPRGALTVQVVGDRLYAIGGVDPQRSVSYPLVDIYDFKTGRWSEGAPLPSGRDHIGGAVSDGRVYVLGGRGRDRIAVSEFDEYDPRTDRWHTLPEVPYPTSGIGLVEIDGRLVTAGGEDPARGRLIGYSWAYDLKERRWERLPAMRKPKHGYAVAAHDGRFWAFGGSACYGYEPDAGVSSVDATRN
jgi:non-specific serine/threonine protein kinase